MNSKDYVTYATAKLLKAAGFAEKTKHGYTDDGLFIEYSADYPAPHLWTAMKWLRERHGMCAVVFPTPCEELWVAELWSRQLLRNLMDECNNYPTYAEAVDAAIARGCEWLVGSKQ